MEYQSPSARRPRLPRRAPWQPVNGAEAVSVQQQGRENLPFSPRLSAPRPPFSLQPEAVQLGERLGNGAYAEVRKASVPCAAKILHGILDSDPLYPRNRDRFMRECRILCACVHPNIVRFYGVSSYPETGQTILLMELMQKTLTDFLEAAQCKRPLPYFLQLNISHDVANGVCYLHSQGVLHRDLSSNNVLLTGPPHITAKISDFGMCSFKNAQQSPLLTKCPGTPVYMPPEALHTSPSATQTQYEKIDSFQMGVLMLQIATCLYPSPIDSPTRRDNPQSPTGFSLDLVPEHKRREEHLKLLRNIEHPLLDHPILECLEDREEKRPTSECVYEQLSALLNDQRYLHDCEREGVTTRVLTSDTELLERDGKFSTGSLRKKVEFLEEENKSLRASLEREREATKTESARALRKQNTLRLQLAGAEEAKREAENQRAMESERAGLLAARLEVSDREREEEKKRFEWQLQAKERETDNVTRYYEAQLRRERDQFERGKGELSRQLEALRRAQPYWGGGLTHTSQQCALKNGHTHQQEARPRSQTERLELTGRRNGTPERRKYYKDHSLHMVGGGFKRPTTAGCQGNVELELRDSAGNPVDISSDVTTYIAACLIGPNHTYFECAVLNEGNKLFLSFIPPFSGRYSLDVSLGGVKRELQLPSICAYPNPSHHLVPRVFISSLKRPWSMAINASGELLICENSGNRVAIYDIRNPMRPKRYIRDRETLSPTGVAVDDAGDIYITSKHKLQKFSGQNSALVASLGRDKEGETNKEFHYPSSVTAHQGEIFVSDQKNGRVQVFDVNLKYARTIFLENRRLFNDPCDVAFDKEGRMYVAEYAAERVVVFSPDGRHTLTIGKGEGVKPESIHIVNDHLYISDFNRKHNYAVAVFQVSGAYLTSFGRHGHQEGVWSDPRGITSFEGNVYVCGSDDGHVHIV